MTFLYSHFAGMKTVECWYVWKNEESSALRSAQYIFIENRGKLKCMENQRVIESIDILGILECTKNSVKMDCV